MTMTTPEGLQFVRTPEERFAQLPGFPYEPRYETVAGLRMVYIDQGPAYAPPVLLLHGEPTWGFLYRRMIPGLLDAGLRVVVPDIIGFGRSDKPTERSAYTYEGHVAWMRAFVTQLDLRGITLFGQDWGGLIGLRVLTDLTDRFARAVVANTGLPDVDNRKVPPMEVDPDASLARVSSFPEWLVYSQTTPVLSAGEMVQRFTHHPIPADVQAAYDAPFPDETYMAGAREFPCLVATNQAQNQAAWQVLREWRKPFLTLWAPNDPIVGRGMDRFQNEVPGAAGLPHDEFEDASHFLQEDVGEQLAERIVALVEST